MKLLLTLLAVTLSVASAAPLPIDALTFNIRHDNPSDGEDAWPKRQKMVGDWLSAELPDVVGLQEALRHQIDDLLKAVLAYTEFRHRSRRRKIEGRTLHHSLQSRPLRARRRRHLLAQRHTRQDRLKVLGQRHPPHLHLAPPQGQSHQARLLRV